VARQLHRQMVAEAFLQHGQQPCRRISPAFLQQPPQRAAGAARQQDDALGMGLEQFQRDGRLAGGVVPQEAVRGEALDVLQPLRVHRQRHHRVRQQAGDFRAIIRRGAGQVQLAADDGLHALAGAVAGKFQRAEHVGGIGQRKGRHAGILGQHGQLVGLDGPLGEGIGGMGVQMDEGRAGHGEDIAPPPPGFTPSGRNDAAFAQRHHPVHAGGEVRVMGGDQRRNPGVTHRSQQFPEHQI
jgi:hypothetical protein